MRAALSIGLLLAVSACSADEAAIQVSPTCRDDNECAGNQTCFRGQCTARSVASRLVADVEITPPSSSPLSRVQLLDVAFDTRFSADLDVPDPTRFDTIRVLDTSEAPIAARVAFTGRDRIVTRELDAQLLLDPDRDTGIALAAGTYDVRVLPTDAARRPGVEIRDFLVRPNGSLPRRDLVIPSTYRTVTGEVTRRTSMQVKIAGVTVHARSLGAGLPSTRAVTDTDGRFSILLPDTPDTSFELIAEPSDEQGLGWGFVQTITVLSPGRTVSIPLEETTDAVRGTLQLRVLGMGPQGAQPVAGAHVVLTASTGVDYRALTLEGVTDDDGRVVPVSGVGELTVLAARYHVLIEPPITGAWQVRRTRLDLSQVTNKLVVDKQLELPAKVHVRGTVASSLGQPVSEARLRFTPLDNSSRTTAGTTDTRGAYDVLLDAGSYVVTVAPTPNSRVNEPLPVGFARLEVPADVAERDAEPVLLPSGSVLRASIRDARGAPVADATFELYTQLDQVPISLGRTTSDARGAIELIVPVVGE